MKKYRLLEKSVMLGFVLMGFLVMMLSVNAKADNTYFNNRIEQLKTKFPEGKYWNHVGIAGDNSDGYTNSPCTLHKVNGIHTTGTGGCTCNHFVNTKHGWITSQCMGFAYKLGYDMFGDVTWIKYTANGISNIRIGDIVRLREGSSEHSVFVAARNGNVITAGEANYYGPCRISWTRQINLAATTILYYERASNYDAAMVGTVQVPQQPTEETQATEATTENYTGWKKAEDGVHYQYVQKGEVLKNEWVTVDKKKYYLGPEGYRATDLYIVDDKIYFFNASGALQTKKWVETDDGKAYYIGDKGYALKSQWLYKGNVQVYVKDDGTVAKNELVQIGSNTYYFNASGKRSKGFKKYNDQYYYCNKSGVIQKKCWVKKGTKKYYMQKNGIRAESKLVKINGKNYYFNENGVLQKKKKIIYSGRVYKADNYGRCKFVGYAEE